MSSWEQKITDKRQARRDTIPKEWRIYPDLLLTLKTPIESHKNNIIGQDLIRKSGVLSSHELHITENFSVEGLLGALASGTLTAVEVTLAYSKRAAVAQQLVNCLTEKYFEKALKRAKYLDSFKAQGRTIGPLHGLPISLKDSFQVAGSQATLGIVSFLDRTSKKNSPLVDILLELGAILYVKTNVPQTLATVDTDNNIFGRTLNPWNTSLGAGGSSGGEGALVSLHGSPLGVGTDLGGSVRIPALCCGTYGFKPTASRILYGGQQDCSAPGMDFILASAGPLSYDINALEIFMRSVVNARPSLLDSSVIDLPWRSLTDESVVRFRIGLLAEDPQFPLHPPVKRTMAEAVRKLQAQGQTIIPLDAAKCHIANATEIAWKIFMIDETAYKHVHAGEEPLIPSVVYTHAMARSLGSKFIPDLSGYDHLSQLAVLRKLRAVIIDDWRQIWLDNELDLVLSPSAQTTAVEHDRFGLPAYTTLTNILDYPSCVLPFLHVTKEASADHFEKKHSQNAPEYKYHDIEGAPTSVQIFTRSMHDEEYLHLAKIIASCLKADP